VYTKKSKLIAIRIVIVVIIIASLILSGVFEIKFMTRNQNSITKVFGGLYSPYNTDPIAYDDFIHHMAWTSVFGTLVSQYKVGEITGQIADSWQSNKDYSEWSFKIKKDCYFENGDLINPKIVAQSFKRIALVQFLKKSNSGFTEDLVGIQDIQNMQSSLPGITFDEDTVTFKFVKSKSDLLNKIGFGIYSIVHPSQYNDDGSWIDKKIAISSGPYRIEQWLDNSIHLAINSKQAKCYSYSKNPLEKINLVFGIDNLDIKSLDMVSGSSKSLMIDNSFEFLGPAESSILYIRLNKQLPIETAKALRDVIIYEMASFKNINFELNRSFLPLTVKGVYAGRMDFDEPRAKILLRDLNLKIPKYEPSKKSKEMTHFLSYAEAFSEVMNILSLKYGVNISEVPIVYSKASDSHKIYDIQLLYTGVLVENPNEDIRFMFKSKEGIQLPDTDGSIIPLLDNVSENIGEINNKIWQQSTIIPITHYSSGLWVKKDSYNIRDINHMLPPTNFQFIGYK